MDTPQPNPQPGPSPADPGDAGLAEPTGAPAAESGSGDVQAAPIATETHTARMDLVFSLGETFRVAAGEPAGHRWVGGVPYRCVRRRNTSRSDRAVEQVLEVLTADPARSLSSVDVVDVGEHDRLDEVGNRAALTGVCACCGVGSGGVRPAGCAWCRMRRR